MNIYYVSKKLKVLNFKAEIIMYGKVAKLIIQIVFLVSITISKKSEQKYVSENWHKTQVFIFYNKEHSNEQIADCLGTILSPRFILTTASCIGLSVGTSPSLQHAVVSRIYTGQKNDIVKYKIEKFTIHPDFSPEKQFPDLAILKLTKQMADYNFSSNVAEFYPQDSPGTYLSTETLNLEHHKSHTANTGISQLVLFFGPQATALFEKPH